ncbi:MAG: helix-turn-helix domain-containing protein [bacterium]|nr:helix-turn-helix domain-containing protein [bacterium]
MDNYPKIHFLSSDLAEAERVLHASIQTANGFYYNHGFTILPRLSIRNPQTVHLPKLNYQFIPNYWDRVKQLKEKVPLDSNLELISEIKDVLKISSTITSKELDDYKKQWKKSELRFWDFINFIIPQYTENIASVEVRLTEYGARMSYGNIDPKHKDKLIFYLRKDVPISHLAEGICSSLLRLKDVELGLTWETRETLADFLLSRLVEMKVFDVHLPTIAGLDRQAYNFREESKEYLKSLGLSFERPFGILADTTITHKGVPISAQLTKTQNMLMKVLIEQSNKIVDYDSLGNILWITEEDYSLWAINKNMQRLRKKIMEVTKSENCVKSIKGQGYSLLNS